MNLIDGIVPPSNQASPPPKQKPKSSPPASSSQKSSHSKFLTLSFFVIILFLLAKPPAQNQSQNQVATDNSNNSKETEDTSTLSPDQIQELLAKINRSDNKDPKETFPESSSETLTTPPTTPPEETPPTKSTIDFKVRILNGGATAGSATKLKTDLEAKGYEILSIGNAQNSHETTTLYYLSDHRTHAEQVAKDLGEPAIAFLNHEVASPADILIVIGADRR